MVIPSPLAGAGAPTQRSWPRTDHDDLPLPGGLTVGQVPSAELSRLFIGMGVPGCTASQGRLANVAHYAAHVAEVQEAGAREALQRWLSSARWKD